MTQTANRPQFPTTDIDYSKNLPKHFMKGILFGEQDAIVEACSTCEYDDLRFETAQLSSEDINLMVDMCRVDDYFGDCFVGDWLDKEIDTLQVLLHVWQRMARLEHTFWGVQSHLASYGINPTEDHMADFVKRAVSAYITAENTKKDISVPLEMIRATQLAEGE